MNAPQTKKTKGWSWFERDSQESDDSQITPDDLPTPDRILRKAYARCFSTQEGERVLKHLRAMTLERVLGPGVPAETLRHIEGQRQLVSYIAALTERGRTGQ